MAWLQVEDSIREHDKIYNLADTLKIPDAHAVGLMVCLWCWAITAASDGDITSFPPRAIAKAAGWTKKPETFYKALTDEKSLFIENIDGKMMLRNWEQRASMLIDALERKKELNKQRVQRYRDRKANKENITDNSDVTQGNALQSITSNAGNADVTPLPYHTIPYHNNKDIDSKESKGDKPPEPPEELPADREPVPYKKIQELYIATCPSFPKIMAINGQRKKAVGARWNEHKDIKTFEEVFRKAEASSFMKGHNDRNWTADFDWMMKPTNFTKILEGKYSEKGGGASNGVNSRHPETETGSGKGTEETPVLSGFRMAKDPAGDQE